MTDSRHMRHSSVTVTECDGQAHSVTHVTHPFRGVTVVTVPWSLIGRDALGFRKCCLCLV